MSRFKQLVKDKKLWSGIYVLSVITALLVLVLVIKGPEESGKLIVDDSGRVIGIHRNRTDTSENYRLGLKVEDDESPTERDVSITLRAQYDSDRSKDTDAAEDRAAEISSAVDAVISEIEYSKSKKVMLPLNLPDGTPLSWSEGEKKPGSMTIMIPAAYIALIALMAASRAAPDKSRDEERKSILKGLPRFCNQLFLMMNAGLILSDAFDTITASYRSRDENSLTSFERDIAALCDATDHHRISTAAVISEYAAAHDVKEMVRIAAILSENEKRGSDVVESLSRESRYLWDERKIVARECGKMIDTKMSYPLGMLLILLIVITMAPALLNM